ncbi:MAG: hypothetical protein LBM71_01290 [Elusimicrobiota bacterium]|jgi:hypothetical protein|nr:hypothetical protein [Elusimicrobiota bacterium]
MSFNENIETAVNRISDFLKDKESTTSWQLKINLQLSSSLMYLALGVLSAQGKISLEPDGINYKVIKTPR